VLQNAAECVTGCVAVCCCVLHDQNGDTSYCTMQSSDSLQCVAVCCSMLQDARGHQIMRVVRFRCIVFECAGVCCSVLRCVPLCSMCCRVLH